MLAEAARSLEDEFEKVALDPVIHPQFKLRCLSRLLTRMFDDAIRDIREGAENAHIRGDFVLDFVERVDLGPDLVERGFSGYAESDAGNPGYAALMRIAATKKQELERYMPPPVLRWQR